MYGDGNKQRNGGYNRRKRHLREKDYRDDL
jgi:hypothetical protein